MWKALLIAFVVGAAYATESNETSPGGTKDETAGGHFYGNSGYGYQPPPPQHGYGNPYPQPSYAPPLVDDYVCDIDTSILVVTNAERDEGYGGNGGYGNNNGNHGNNNPYGGGHHHHHQQPQKPNADRLKCAVIANFDEATCTSCCRIAARRDRSILSKSIIGFIVDESQLDYDQNDNNYHNNHNHNNGPYRVKRGAHSPPQQLPAETNGVLETGPLRGASPPGGARHSPQQLPAETYGVPGNGPLRGASPPGGARHSPSTAPYFPPPVAPIYVSLANSLGPKARCVCCAPRKFNGPHFPPPRFGGGY